MSTNKSISIKTSFFQQFTLPEQNMLLAGYSALTNHYELNAPYPRRISTISAKNKRYSEGKWSVFTPRHEPEDSLQGHLTFALKYEGVDLAILNALFHKIDDADIENVVRSEPTGSYTRRIWFFYEWLTAKTLNLNDATKGNYVNALDASIQYTGPENRFKRYRVVNNLPGTLDFCPLIHKTKKLDQVGKFYKSSRTSMDH